MIYVDSLSKTLGGGLRLGWVAASGPVLDRIVAAKRADDIHSPTLNQLALARYLAGGRYSGAGRARARLLPRAPRGDGEIDRCTQLGPIASWIRAARRRPHLWLDARPRRSTSASSPTRRSARASPTCPAARCSIGRPRELSMRLSFGYLEPDEIDEGLRRLALAIGVVCARGRRARSRSAV